ncbi:hypothetical protein [Pedobacter sp. UBA4863]|uniref:hypothetical protein n=1 Tax=Pedobacter sp. UBA4863 TaxID=1947060 RepID=UPI0025ED562F|nr:hypothetical protein [Pedobacter sp. UBA4863]
MQYLKMGILLSVSVPLKGVNETKGNARSYKKPVEMALRFNWAKMNCILPANEVVS